MITCRELIEFLMSYLDGELPPAQHAAFDAHLEACPSCRAYLDTYAETVRLAKAAGAEPRPANKPPESLIRAILEAREEGRGDTGARA